MTYLYLNSDKLGDGDPELGHELLAAFLLELAESDTEINAVGCVNSGIRLTTRDGAALDALKALESKGAHITSCGTCLDHYRKRDQLRIGDVGTMAKGVQAMVTARRVIRPN